MSETQVRREMTFQPEKSAPVTDENLAPLQMPIPLDLSQMEKVLVFVPHPDDETIGCGGLLAKLSDLRVPVHLVLASDASGAGGLPEGAGEQRIEEFRQALDHLGGAFTKEYWRLPDGALDSAPDLPRRIYQIMQSYLPTTVLAPWLRDLHPDHAVLGKRVLDIANGADDYGYLTEQPRQVIFYEVWSPLPATHILSVTDVWSRKIEALSSHKTALSCGDYLRAMEALAAYRSLLSGAMASSGHYAEAYRLVTPVRPERTYPCPPAEKRVSRISALKPADSGAGIRAGAQIQERYSLPEDGPALGQLFAKVFGQAVPDDWWLKKYGSQPQAGALAETTQGEIVGYYGAMHRQGYWQGQLISCAQQGDVMVAPEHRFATRGRGVFLRISRLFLKEQLGSGRIYQFAYGFPTDRALQLGIRLGLYRQGDALGYWQCQNVYSPMGVSWKVSCQPCHEVKDWEWCNRLKPIMEEPEQTFWLQKSSEYWKQRFLTAAPNGKGYHVIRLFRWWRLQAVAVIRIEEDCLEILDLAKVGEHPDARIKLISGIINYALSINLKKTTAWGTRLAVEELKRQAESLHRSGQQSIDPAGYMALPSKELDAPLTEAIQGRCWMLGGDTDFR